MSKRSPQRSKKGPRPAAGVKSSRKGLKGPPAKCDGCAGDGQVPNTCQGCGGEGVTTQQQGRFTVTTQCAQCGGTGGQGSVDCSKCKGTGIKRDAEENLS
jgi:DnaJ-class molecular chaperone